ncbi:MAG: alpha/beta hydrolase [Minisyncoccia bacterium]
MKTTRRKIAHLMVEIAHPEGENRGVLIVLPGLPQLQHKHLFSHQLCVRGWEVWSPQLSGSWDSDGVFSPENHIRDIQVLTAAAPQLRAIVGYSYSTGVAVAYAAESGTATPLVLIGSVLDFKTFKNQADSFLAYLSNLYPLTYRIDRDSLQKYFIGETHVSLGNGSRLSSSVLLVVANDDENHDEATIVSFAKECNATIERLPCRHSLEDFAKQSTLYDIIENHITK